MEDVDKDRSHWQRPNWAKWKKRARRQKKKSDERTNKDVSNLFILAENLNIEGDDESVVLENEGALFRSGSYSMSCSSSNSSDIFYSEECRARIQNDVNNSSNRTSNRGSMSPVSIFEGEYIASFDEDHGFDSSCEIKQKNVFKIMEKIHLEKFDSTNSEEGVSDNCNVREGEMEGTGAINSIIHRTQYRFDGLLKSPQSDPGVSRRKESSMAMKSLFHGLDDMINAVSDDISSSSSSSLWIGGSERSVVAKEVNSTKVLATGTTLNSEYGYNTEECLQPDSEKFEAKNEDMPTSLENGKMLSPPSSPVTQTRDGNCSEKEDVIEENLSELISIQLKEKKLSIENKSCGPDLNSSLLNKSIQLEEEDEIYETKQIIKERNIEVKVEEAESNSEKGFFQMTIFGMSILEFLRELLNNYDPKLGMKKSNRQSRYNYLSFRTNFYCFVAGVLISLLIVSFLWLFVFGFELENQSKRKLMFFYSSVCLVFTIVSICIISALRFLSWLEGEILLIKERLPKKGTPEKLNQSKLKSRPKPSQTNAPPEVELDPSVESGKTGASFTEELSKDEENSSNESKAGSSLPSESSTKSSEETMAHGSTNAETNQAKSPDAYADNVIRGFFSDTRGMRCRHANASTSPGLDTCRRSMSTNIQLVNPLVEKNPLKKSYRIIVPPYRTFTHPLQNNEVIRSGLVSRRRAQRTLPNCSLWESKPSPRSSEPKPLLNESCILFVGKKVLVVDDNTINRRMLGNSLLNLGMVVDFAKSGKEALEKLTPVSKRYFCIFMDLHMPEMDGYEATALIRRMEMEESSEFCIFHTPILGVTGDILAKAREKCMQCGMDELLIKPLTQAKIEDILTKYLNI